MPVPIYYVTTRWREHETQPSQEVAARNVRDEVLQVVEELRLMSVMAELDAPQSVMAAAQRPDSKCTLLHLLFAPRP